MFHCLPERTTKATRPCFFRFFPYKNPRSKQGSSHRPGINFEHKKTVKQAKSYSPAKQIAVPSALEGLTSGFGMGPGGPPPLFSPASTALSKLVKRSFARFTRLTTRHDTSVSAEVSHLLSPRLRTKRIINRLRPRRFSTG